MVWQLRYDPAAEKDLSKLDRAVQRSVKRYPAEVCELDDPAQRWHPLSGPLAGHHRYRIGQLRIIVRIQRLIVTVTVIQLDRRDTAY